MASLKFRHYATESALKGNGTVQNALNAFDVGTIVFIDDTQKQYIITSKSNNVVTYKIYYGEAAVVGVSRTDATLTLTLSDGSEITVTINNVEHATSADTADTAKSVAWNNITGKPTNFVTTDGTQTITGSKTFTNNVSLQGSTSADSITTEDLIVNGAARFVSGLTGDLKGNVVGNVTGNVTGNVSGSSGSCTGNALTATTLQTARSINGTSFNGSQAITTAKWGTARNITITDNTNEHTQANNSIDGSADFTLKLPTTIKADIIGNASTADSAKSVDWANVTNKPNLVTTDTEQTITGAKIFNNNTTFNNETDVESLTADSLLVTGSARFTNTINGNLKGNVEGNLAGNASTATTAAAAIQDGNGNVIANTYLPLSGGTITGPIKFSESASSNLSNNYLSAGGGYSPNSGRLGLKLVSIDQSDIQAGIGVDLTGFTYETTISTGRRSDTTTSYITFATHNSESSSYKRLGYFKASGDADPSVLFYVGGTIEASKFIGSLQGNATTASSCTGNAATATEFSSNKAVTLTGDVTGSASSKGGWSIATTIANGVVTNAKLANSKVTIAGTEVSLGGSIAASTIGAALTTSAPAAYATNAESAIKAAEAEKAIKDSDGNVINTTYIKTVTLASGTNNGTLKLTVGGTTVDNIAVKGLGSAAYTDSESYAKASHIHNYLPLSGGQMNNTAFIAWNSGADGNDLKDWSITNNGLRIISSTSTTSKAPTQYATGLHVKGRYGFQIASQGGKTSNEFFIKNIYNTIWNTLLHSNNYTSYTVKKDGTGASGTWGINISGNASTATKATNADRATGDSDGNAINTTYLKRSGGTVTGNVTFNSSVTADSITSEDLIVNGASRFVSGITGDLVGNVTGNVTGNLSGNASSATKAINDGNGNTITSTYATKTERANNDITAASLNATKLTLTRAAGNITANIPTWNQDTTGTAAKATADAKGNNIINTYATKAEVAALPKSMVIKGTLDASHALPTSGMTEGDTYIVGASGKYNNIACKVGDFFVRTSNSWLRIPAGDEWEYNENTIKAIKVNNAGHADTAGTATSAGVATNATNSDKVDEFHAMSSGSLLYKYEVTATIPASSISGDFWYATITFSRSYSTELTKSLLSANYSNIYGQVYLNTYDYRGAWYAFTSTFNGSNIKGIALKAQNNPIYYVKLAKPIMHNNNIQDGTITVRSPYNCTITVSDTAPSGVTFTNLTIPGFTNLKASSAVNADTATTALSCSGNADNATKDGSGNNIVNTYARIDKVYDDSSTYRQFLGKSGSSSDWIRTTERGIIPYTSGDASNGHSRLGTPDWYFSKAYIQNIYGYLNGNISGSSTSCSGNAATATNADKLGNLNADNYFKQRDAVFNSDWGGKYLWTLWDNHLYAADKRFAVTLTGTDVTNLSYLFDGSFESSVSITETKAVLHIKHTTAGNVWTSGLPYGSFYVVFYNSDAENVTGRVYCNYDGQGIGWHDLTATHVRPHVWELNNGYHQLSDLEITITKPASSASIQLCQVLHEVTRSAGPDHAAVMSKYCNQKTNYNIEAAKFIGPLQGNATTATTASSCSGNSATATKAGYLDTGTMTLYAHNSNEINFGGTSGSDTIYFGYRATENRPIPTSFIFGGSGTATLTAGGFKKSGSSSSYVLTGDGGHAAISGLSVNYATSAGTATTAGDANTIGGISISKLVYGSNSTKTTNITEDQLNAPLASGFYTITNTTTGSSATIPNATSVSMILHTSYSGLDNNAGFDLLINDSLTSSLHFRPATGSGKGAWKTLIDTGNIGSQSVNYATTSGACTGNSATATKATQDSDGNAINTTYLKRSGGTVTGNVTFNSSVTSDSLTTEDLIVNGAARFVSGLTGDLVGNVTGNLTGTASYATNAESATIAGSATTASACTGNAATATKLQTARTIWGQSFDGSRNISGSLTGVTNIAASGSIFSNNYGANGNTAVAAFIFNKGGDCFGIGASSGGVSNVGFGTTTNTTGTWKSEMMTITNSGNVGIGTTSPTSKLHVAGTGYFASDVSSAANIIAGGYIKGETVKISSGCTLEYSSTDKCIRFVFN